jgi:hypothetical protein
MNESEKIAPIEETKEPVNYVMNIIKPDGTLTEDFVQFTKVKHLGSGRNGRIYLAETTYAPEDAALPGRVAVKVARERDTADRADLDRDVFGRDAVNTLIKIRGAIKRPRPGMMAFPVVYAVEDETNKPYSYAMDLVDPEAYGGIYTADGNINSLVTMFTVYADAVDIMIDADIAQNDRKVTDIVWFESGKKLRILDWDVQASVSGRGGEAKVIKGELFQLGEIARRFLWAVRGPQGHFLTEEQIEDMDVLRKSLPQPVFDLIRLVMQKKLPEKRESLDGIKLKTLMLREKIKESAMDLITYQLADLQNRREVIESYLHDQYVSDKLPRSLIEAASRSKEKANREAIWEAARTEMAIHLKAREYLQSIKMWTPTEFDGELARILDKQSGHALTQQQVLSAIREKAGLNSIEGIPQITSFDPNSIDNEVLLHLYRIAGERK